MADVSKLLAKANTLPLTPGVYLMKNAEGKIIYVGKAKKLKNRVTSYFRGTQKHPKTAKMVSEVDDFEVVVAESELDALLTECSLIQKHSPVYNIKLKNGGGYPFICVTEKEGLPLLRIEKNRTLRGRCFGPFTSGQTAAAIIKLINKVFQLPSCASGKKNISALSRNGKGCLEYQIHACRGFCRKDFTEEARKETFEEIYSLLSGNVDEIHDDLEAKMEKAAEDLDFEYAAEIRDRIFALNTLKDMRRPTIAHNRNADYISYVSGLDGENKSCSIFMLRIRKGFVIGERCDHFDEGFSEDLLGEYIERFYSENPHPDCKIYIEENQYQWLEALNKWLNGAITFPSLKQDFDILELCKKNAAERRLQLEGKTRSSQRALAAFRDFSGIKKADRIEAYDISSIAGELVVCGMITLIDGAFKPAEYKKFKIEKTLGQDDTSYMKEAVTRRLQRYNDGDEKFSPLPDLIICDGALGQIHAVEEALMLSGNHVPVVGLKKDSKHRTKALVFSSGKEMPLVKHREAFAFCTRLQDEVHRYAISYHKNLRDALTRQSSLTKIPGIGKKRARELFLKFKSVEKIGAASVEELCKIKGINENLAKTIISWIKENY